MKVTFTSKYSVFAVKAEEGTLVSLTGTPTEKTDGVYTVGDSGMIVVDTDLYTDSIYLDTDGDDYTVASGARIAYPADGVEIWAGSSPISVPFPKKAKGGGGSVINVIPLATPTPVKIEGNGGEVWLSGDVVQSLVLKKDYNYNPQISAYIDITPIVSTDILSNKNAKIKGIIELSANTRLTVTFQMFIGNEPPKINDWVTIASELVSSGSPYRDYFNINVSDINPSSDTDGRLYFRMIHGDENSSYTSYATVRYLHIES